MFAALVAVVTVVTLIRGRGRATRHGVLHRRLGLVPWDEVVAVAWDGWALQTEVVVLVRGHKEPIVVAWGSGPGRRAAMMRRTATAVERFVTTHDVPSSVAVLPPTGPTAALPRNAAFPAGVWWPWDPRSRPSA